MNGWFRMGDNILDHPVLGTLTYAELGLYTEVMGYCTRHLLDGRMPKSALDVQAKRRQARLVARLEARLCSLGLWIDRGDHYEVSNFLAYNPSRSEAQSGRPRTGKKGVVATASNALHDAHREEKRREEDIPAEAGKTIDQLLFDAITTALSIDQYSMTASARSGVNVCVKQLKDAGADPDDVKPRVGAYKRKFPNAACTPFALAKHWPALSLMVPIRRAPQPEPVEPQGEPMTADKVAALSEALGRVGRSDA